MKRVSLFLFCSIIVTTATSQTSDLPVYHAAREKLMLADWMVKPVSVKADVYKSPDLNDVIIYTGVAKRSFRLAPNLACIEYKNMINGQQLNRSIRPEAIVKINGNDYAVGGLYGQKEHAYLKTEWLDDFSKRGNDFQFT